MTAKVRIHAYLAQIGIGSRREMERQIQAGRIAINGKPAKLGQLIDPSTDAIKYRGKNITTSRSGVPSVIIALHKPRGVVTTMKDPEGRETVSKLVPRDYGRLFPVGRLDVMSEGLLLMTNDGEIANRMTHPRFEVPKTYEVRIRGQLDAKKVAYLERGVKSPEAKFKPVEVLDLREVTKEGLEKFKVTVRIYEGKNRHVRKLFDAVKCRVIRLKRISMGPILLKGIPRGGYVILSKAQIDHLRKDLGL